MSSLDNTKKDEQEDIDAFSDPEDHLELNGDAVDSSEHSLTDEFETNSLSGENEQDLFVCKSCQGEYKKPRVLSCLHAFCEECLRLLLVEDCIVCPTCKQTTECECISELPLDYVIANSLDMKAIESNIVTCTSCKAKEKAVARCSDCANFLCPNCVTAHQFMRCFENHKVISFDDIMEGDGLPLHRPITCNVHGEEQLLKYFCNTCQVPICNECMLHEHKQPAHQYERISDIENRETAYMLSLVNEAQAKINRCEETSDSLQQSLTELESQRDDAKSLITETFQSYKVILEKRQDALLRQLEQLHEQQELSVMEMFHNVNSTVEKIEEASNFVKRFVSKSNCSELLSLKKTMSQRLISLMRSSLTDTVSVDIEFVTDAKKFESAVEDSFGHFKLRDDSSLRTQHQQQQQQQQPIRQTERQPSLAALGDVELGFTTSSPPNLVAGGYTNMMSTAPMLGSPDSGLCSDNQIRPILSNDYSSGFLSSTCPTTTTISDHLGLRSAVVSSMSGTLIGDARSQSRQSQSPTVSDSGIGMDTNSPGSRETQAPPLTLAELSKLGQVTLSPQGQVIVNNQALPGLNITDMATLTQALSSNLVLGSTSPDQDLSHSHNSGMFSPIGRAMMPSNDGLIGQRRDTARSISGGSGFTSPTPSQQAAPPFPMRGKMSAMQIRAKFGQLGPSKGQFNSPHGFCMGLDEDIVVADTNNHRIQVFDKSGEFKYQFGIPGREEGQLWYPRKVAIMRGTGRYVICDRGNERSRMQIFTKNGHFVKKIAIRYIDIVAGLAITPQGNIVAVDSVSPTVFTIAESGDLIRWFDCSDYMREPSDIAVADKEYFVCDFKGHCVVVFTDDGLFQRRIGTDSITNFPNGIDISDAGDILVGDSHGNRFHVAVFQKDGSLIGEFECPYVKVSRCCGLKITSEGYVVTLAKNNHHVLVLNTLYIS